MKELANIERKTRRRWRLLRRLVDGGGFSTAVCGGTTAALFVVFAFLGAAVGRTDVDSKVLKAEQYRIRMIQRLAPAVVAVFDPRMKGGGSGVLVSRDGFALTNFHVVAAADSFMKCGLNDGRLYDAVLVGVDPTGDVALIKLLGRDDFPTAQWGDSDTVRVGDWVFALGNPFLLATDFQPTVTYGMVSGVHRYQYPAGTLLEYTDCIQVDAPINPGNSGGPLFDYSGKLIGINGRISTDKRGRVNSGVGYAISINQIKNFWDHLRSGRIVDHASLGAVVQTQEDGSVVVSGILETSDVYRRGLRLGDEIVSFGGRPIGSANEFKNVLGIFPAGWRVPLVFRRDGVKHKIVVRLERLHRDSALAEMPHLFGPSPRPGKKEKKTPQKKKPPHKKLLPEKLKLHPRPVHSVTVPDKYKKFYIPKEGFANYYFNKLEQERLKQLLKQLGDFSSRKGVWLISGRDDQGRSFVFTLTDKAAGLEWGKNVSYVEWNDPAKDEPAGSGGLVTAVACFRRLLVYGTGRFTDCYYLGAEPLESLTERADVLVTTFSEVQLHWYFSRSPARLVGFDTWVTTLDDPCEIRFEEFKNFGNVRLPAKWLVRHGDTRLAVFHVERVQFKSEQKSQ